MKFYKKIIIILFFIFLFQDKTYAQEYPKFIPTNLYLKFGGNNVFIEKLQGFINNYYNAGIKTDGIFGSQTKNQVVEFQKSQGLTPDGVVGPKTLERINELSNSPQSQSQTGSPESSGSQTGSSETGNGTQSNPEKTLDVNSLNNSSTDSSIKPLTSSQESLLNTLKGKNSGGSVGSEKCGGLRLVCTGRATIFNHASVDQACIRDKNDQQFGGTSASGVKLGQEGKPGIPAVALPAIVRSQKGVSFGTAVEVLNVATGVCKSFPLLDAGPGKGPLSAGVVIDLTGSAYDALMGKKNCEKLPKNLGTFIGNIQKVKYYVNVTGTKLSPGQIGECTSLK